MTQFPIDKILSCTPTEYCNSVNKELHKYKLVGVNVGDHNT